MRAIYRLATLLLFVLASRTATAERKNGVYVEALGKGGVWGFGFDHRVARWATLGAVGSAFSQEGQRYVTLTPYVGFYLLRHGRSAWFADAGAPLAYTWTMSPVPEWSGDSAAGIGGSLSSGYEFRGRLIARLFLHGVVGKGGVAPWAGTSIGWAF
jgi:hypothetical protein